MRKPLVDNEGNVVNIIEIEEGANYKEPDGLHMLDEHPDAAIGGKWDSVQRVFIPPVVDIPDVPEGVPAEDKLNAIQQVVNEGGSIDDIKSVLSAADTTGLDAAMSDLDVPPADAGTVA